MFDKRTLLAVVVSFAVAATTFAAITAQTPKTIEAVRAEVVASLAGSANMTSAQFEAALQAIVANASPLFTSTADRATLVAGVLEAVSASNVDEAVQALIQAGIPAATVINIAISRGFDATAVTDGATRAGVTNAATLVAAAPTPSPGQSGSPTPSGGTSGGSGGTTASASKA
jgi:hypothetical protein